MAYFENLLLPDVRAADVRDALCHWYSDAGYSRQTGRLLFDLFDHFPRTREDRVFVISNEKRCLLINTNSFDQKHKLLDAFASFPVLVQLWARDGGWGYRLQERGRLTDVYNSKMSQRIPGEPRLPVQESLTRLANVCGIPLALPLLKRVQKSRPLFLEKKCGNFANALGVPLAVHRNIHELDRINAGITEPRDILGWQCQLLCFKRDEPAPKLDLPPFPGDPSLSPEQRDQLVQRSRKRARWFWVLLLPFTTLVALLSMPLMLGLFLLASLNRSRSVRRLFMGDAVLFCDEFLKQLEDSEPKRIQIQGDTVINTRHGCSITLFKPATIFPDAVPLRKSPKITDSLFEIELGEHGLSCTARPPGSKSSWRHEEILEIRDLSTSGYPVQFQKSRPMPSASKTRWLAYNWEVQTSQATYSFHCTTRNTELSPADIATFEKIVLSFKAPLLQIP
jgi:hypothetical protein